MYLLCGCEQCNYGLLRGKFQFIFSFYKMRDEINALQSTDVFTRPTHDVPAHPRTR